MLYTLHPPHTHIPHTHTHPHTHTPTPHTHTHTPHTHTHTHTHTHPTHTHTGTECKVWCWWASWGGDQDGQPTAAGVRDSLIHPPAQVTTTPGRHSPQQSQGDNLTVAILLTYWPRAGFLSMVLFKLYFFGVLVYRYLQRCWLSICSGLIAWWVTTLQWWIACVHVHVRVYKVYNGFISLNRCLLKIVQQTP